MYKKSTNIFKPEDIGIGNRLYFKGDKELYYSKNVASDTRYVFVIDKNNNYKKKLISDIIQLDNKKLQEIKINSPKQKGELDYKSAVIISKLKGEIVHHVLDRYNKEVKLGNNYISETNLKKLIQISIKSYDDILYKLIEDYISLRNKFV